MRQIILEALEDRYNAQISEADATLKIYLEHSVGIGEHPQHIDEVDKLIEKIANAEEKLNYAKKLLVLFLGSSKSSGMIDEVKDSTLNVTDLLFNFKCVS